MQVLKWSREGLEERGHGEEEYLDPLDQIAQTCRPSAAILAEKFHNEWNQSVDPLYTDEYSH